LSARVKFSVESCGKVRDSGPVEYVVDANGVFTEDPLAPIVGQLTAQGGSGRVFSVSYDATNTDIIRSVMQEGATALCGSAYTLSSAQTSASLKLSKRGTRATVRQRAGFSGTLNSATRAGVFKSKDRGNWLAAP
jgi:hypothetical protein